MQLEIINSLEYPDWDNMLLKNEDCSFFHSLAWARVLSESYSYTPLYFVVTSNGRLSALIPVMEVNSFLTGKRGVSLPFTDYCQPILSDRTHSKEIIDSLIDYGKRAGWKYIEYRGGENSHQQIIASSFYYGHTLDLTKAKNEQEILSRFRSSTKRNIKKAIKEEVNVALSNSLESIKEFYCLNCMTRKEHGLPPQPYFFFKKIYEHIISGKKGFVALANYKNRHIAGAVYFHFGENAIYKYGASDKSYQKLRANNLVMWEAIKWYAQNGFKHFSFGRTDLDHEGLLQFKRGWGATEKIIKYYKGVSISLALFARN